MKKVKRLLAILLGAIMVVGCLSVSAANSALDVTSKPQNAIYFEDFSGATLDTVHIATGSASLQSGALKAAPATATNFAKITFAPEGITAPVYLEFDVIQEGLKGVSDVQVQMALKSTSGDFLDFRWYNANPAFVRVVGNGVSADATCDTSAAHIKFKIDGANKKIAMWVNDQQVLSEDTGADYVRYSSNFTNLASLNIDMNKQISGLSIDNIALYSAKTSTIPAVGEEICHYDFDQAGTFTGTDLIITNTDTTYTLANGALTMDCDTKTEKSTKIYLSPDKAKLTGKYVVEMVIGPPWYRTSQKHRINFGSGNGGTNYIQWAWSNNSSYGVTKGLLLRHSGGGSVSPAGTGTASGYSIYDGSFESTDRMAEFGADTSYNLKITQLFDTENNTVDLWFNEVYAGQRSFTSDTNDNYTSVDYVDFNLYAGNLLVYDLRAYRPATYTYDATTGLSVTEDANTLTLATNAAKAGRLYFATYEGEEGAKTLADLGTAAISMEPGKVYKVSKADWADAKAFFWDANLKPIVNAWDLQ